MGPITSFSGEYRFLSNFYERPIEVGNRRWASSEHAYQAAKSLLISDWDAIQSCRTPGEAKRMGMRISLRPDWHEVRLPIMEEIVAAKFDQHDDLRLHLIMSNPSELIEGNHWGDVFWGVCKGRGENHLGKILMKIREEYLHNG